MGHAGSVTACGHGVTNHTNNNAKNNNNKNTNKESLRLNEDDDDDEIAPIVTAATTTTSKRRITKYRERRESGALKKSDVGLTRKQYIKYRRYRKERSKYMKMSQLIESLLSLNPKNLEHMLMLRKTDSLDIEWFYSYRHEHLPQLARVSQSLSFYAVSFKPICNSRKLWHILLQDRCHKHVVFSEDVIRVWIGQLLSALSFLHKHNIVHLDISPQSILISENRLILSGFDTCMLVNDHITYNVSTQLFNCCWQLPPCIRRRNDFNGFELKSFDAWSVGVLTFLLLSAKFPFFKDKHKKRIPEAQYVANEESLSHCARDFVSKLLSSSCTNRLSVDSALHHPWITTVRAPRIIRLDGTIYTSMYTHHEHKLKIKYHILAQQTKQCLFKGDEEQLSLKINKLNHKIFKIESNTIKPKYFSSSESDSSASSSSSSSSSIKKAKQVEHCTTARIGRIHKKKKRKRTHSDSLRHRAHKKGHKRRDRAYSQHTYSDYRSNNIVNKIDVQKWQEDDHAYKAAMLSPLMDATSSHHVHPQTNFIRVSDHQLTPSRRGNNPPMYSRGSGHQTNATTPNPTTSSSNNRLSPNQCHNDDRFGYKQHKTSLGNLIAIERSSGPNSSPKEAAAHLPTINQYCAFDIDMLTADHIADVQTLKPRKPLLPPKIIKLDSPSQTVKTNVSSSSSRSATRDTKKAHAPRGFQITRRPVSPSKTKQDPVVMPLISNSDVTTTDAAGVVQDYISSDVMAMNEYDPLDLNDSALPKEMKLTAFPVLSEENLSLHDQHLSSTQHANKSGMNLMALGSTESSRQQQKDGSGSEMELKRSAMDIVRAHKSHNDNANAKFMEYLAQPQDVEGTPRSSIMSLENILQERGMFKSDKVKQTRDVVLDAFDARLLVNNPAIQMRCDMKKKKKSSVNALVLTPSVTQEVDEEDEEYKEHADIHHNIQQQVMQQRSKPSQSDVIHPQTQSLSVPITSPSPLIATTHYSFGSSRQHVQSMFGDAFDSAKSSISTLSSPHGTYLSHNNNNNNNNGRNRNSNNQIARRSRDEDEWSAEDADVDVDGMCDGRTSMF
eukprot:846787_1